MMSLAFVLVSALTTPSADGPEQIRLALTVTHEVDVAELTTQLAGSLGVTLSRAPRELLLPAGGLAGSLAESLLKESLGPEFGVVITDREVIVTLPRDRNLTARRTTYQLRLTNLAARARNENLRRKLRYGLHARKSYRPNDPSRPTVCLIHGLNSTSDAFIHMFGPLEDAGFGVVVYEFPYNRAIGETITAFQRDWAEFRARMQEKRPWSVLTHSMGALIVRAYVEDPRAFAHDVDRLILIAPPNRGSALADAQTVLQLIRQFEALNGRRKDALALMADGLGAVAQDLAPGSPFLTALNQRPRNPEVRYHILAGDGGFLTKPARHTLEVQLKALGQGRGLFGKFVKLAGMEVQGALDELTEGLGDGCVSLAGAKLDGVEDLVILHANHVELIRGPMLYPEPGPVACMPYVLKWLKEPLQETGKVAEPTPRRDPPGELRDRTGPGAGTGSSAQ